MIQSKTRPGKRLVSRAILLAEAALLCIASSTTVAAIVDSGPVSITVPSTIDGIYLNVVTGATGTTPGTAPAGWDFNPYARIGPLLGAFWCAPAACGGVTDVAGGTMLSVLAPGTVIGPASNFTKAVAGPSPNFLVTQTAYMGMAFTNEATGATNYGYLQLSTTAATGFPATIVRYVYENTGAAITIPAGASAPIFSYTPAAASTVGFTGGGAIGSTGNASITAAVATAGVGTGAASTTTTTCTAPTAPFTGFGQSITAEGTGAISGGPLSGTCTLGAAEVTQTLTCSENRGGTATAVTFTLSCPAGTAVPVTSTPVSGSTVTLAPQSTGGTSPTSTIAFQNPGVTAAAAVCTAPTAPEFSVAPLNFAVPPAGSASTTVTFNSAVAGNFTGVLNCTVGAQQFTFNLSGSAVTPTAGETVAIPTVSEGMRGLMVLLMLAFGITAVGVYNRRS